jgi:hypothetical protein
MGVGGEGGRASAARSGDPLIGKSGDRKNRMIGKSLTVERGGAENSNGSAHAQECLCHRNAERLELAAYPACCAALSNAGLAAARKYRNTTQTAMPKIAPITRTGVMSPMNGESV